MRLACLLSLCAVSPLVAQSARFDATAWQEDVRVSGRELPARHPNLFYRMTRAQWDSAVTATERRMPSLSRDQALVALMELVALVHDAHTSLNPLFAPAAAVRYYGVELCRFDDGVFIRKAAPADAALAGARVLRIGRVSIDSALLAAGRLISHENDWWAGTWAPLWLTLPEVLDGLGLAADVEALPLVIERASGGRRETVTIKPLARLVPISATTNSSLPDIRVGTGSFESFECPSTNSIACTQTPVSSQTTPQVLSGPSGGHLPATRACRFLIWPEPSRMPSWRAPRTLPTPL